MTKLFTQPNNNKKHAKNPNKTLFFACGLVQGITVHLKKVTLKFIDIKLLICYPY